jgi:hypothetical protein
MAYQQQAINFASKYPNAKVDVNQKFDQRFEALSLSNNSAISPKVRDKNIINKPIINKK